MNKEQARIYKEQRAMLSKRFEEEKTGEQNLFENQTKLFHPITETQKEVSKKLEDKILAGQDILTNTLAPFTTEFKRRNDQIEALQSLHSLGIENVPQSTPQSTPQKGEDLSKLTRDPWIIDLDNDLLNQTHQDNLELINQYLDKKGRKHLQLPSQIFQEVNTIEEAFQHIEETLESIKSVNKSRGQLLADKSQKKTAGEKESYKSQQDTMKIYKQKTKALSRI